MASARAVPAVPWLVDSIKSAFQSYPGAIRNTTVALIVYGFNEIVESENFFQCPNKNFALYASCFFVIPALFLIVATIFLHSGFWKLFRGCCHYERPDSKKDEKCWIFVYRRSSLVKILCQSFLSGFLWIFWALLQRKYFSCARLGGSKEAKLMNATFEDRLKIEADYANTERNSQIAALLLLGVALIVAFVVVSVNRCRFQPEFGSLPSSSKCEMLRAEAAVQAFKENMKKLAQEQGKRRADMYFAKIKNKNAPEILKEYELSPELLEQAYDNLTTVNEFKEECPPLEDFKHLQAQAAVTSFKERVQQEGKQKVEHKFIELTWHGSNPESSQVVTNAHSATAKSSVDGTQPNTGENVPTESSSRRKSGSKDGRGTFLEDSRTDEIIRCQSLLQDACDEKNTPLVPMLNHSLEEICWQAYNDRRPIVILLVNPYVPSQSRGQMLRFLQRFQEECGECFFWAAETSSRNGKKVLEKYGSGEDDQLIFLVPSTQQAPIFVDRIEGEAFSGFNIGKLYDRIKCMIQGINIEREQLNKMKSNEVEKGSEPRFSNLKQSEECSSGSIILIQERTRDVRRKRVSVAPLKDGMKVILHLPGNKVIARRFCRGACFQEVYVWAGSMEDVPLHFTIHCGGKLVTHECLIDDHCVATLVKRTAEEAAQMLSSQVSFDGSYTFHGPQELYTTLPDDSQATQEPPSEEGGIIKEKKRRKDKRTTSERKRAKKEKSAAASDQND